MVVRTLYILAKSQPMLNFNVVQETDKSPWFVFTADYKRCARLLTRLAVSPMCMER